MLNLPRWILLILVAEIPFCSSQAQLGPYPISSASPVACETIISASKIEGTCCALNSTAGMGCVLNVVGGECTITGQYWTLNYISTEGECPPGEFDVLPNLDSPAPVTTAPTSSPSALPSASPTVAQTGMPSDMPTFEESSSPAKYSCMFYHLGYLAILSLSLLVQ